MSANILPIQTTNTMSSSTDKSSSLSSSPVISTMSHMDPKIRLILSEPSSPLSQASAPDSERFSNASPILITAEDFVLTAPDHIEHTYNEYRVEELKRNQITPLEKAAESIESGKFLSNAAYSKSEVLKDKDTLFRGDFIRIVQEKVCHFIELSFLFFLKKCRSRTKQQALEY